MGSQFTCNDGRCIAAKDRCDNTANCEDASDEEGCDNVLVDPNSYNKKYPPIPEEGMAMEVKVHIRIEKLHNIRELDMTYATKFTLTMEWFDSRLSFKNLLDGDLTNLVKEESKSQLWIPPLFLTTQMPILW